MMETPEEPQPLRRNFDRIVALTDQAFDAMEESGSSLSEKEYKDWATLLLRYHAAIVQLDEEGDGTGIPSIKQEA